MRVYIAGPITDVPDYEMKFKEAEQFIKDNGGIPINPAAATRQMASYGDEFAHAEYMKVTMPLLSLCGCIYLLKGWEKSRGAKQELRWALENGLEVIVQNGNNNNT